MSSFYNENDSGAADWLELLIKEGLIPDGIVDRRSIAEVSAADVVGFDQCHWFAGIGGWALALRLAGWGGRPVWTSSLPCQPFSCAGQRKGTADERHLWPDLFRLIRECEPRVIFGEQIASSDVVGTRREADFVAAVQSGDFAKANKLSEQLTQRKDDEGNVVRFTDAEIESLAVRWVDGIRADLETVRYAFRFAVLGAHSVQAPHERQRLFWMADDASSGHRRAKGPATEAERPPTGHDAIGQLSRGPEGHAVPDGQGDSAIQGREERSWDRSRHVSRSTAELSSPGRDRIIPCRDGKNRRISSESCDGPLAYAVPAKGSDPRMGFVLAALGELGFSPKDFKRLLREARSNRGIRLRGYGNAIVPTLAAEFIRAAMTAIDESTQTTDTRLNQNSRA